MSLEFQLYDWLETNENIENDEGEELPGPYIIHAFGRCEDGKSVYAKITDYTPYFYLLIPNKLQHKSKSEIDDVIKKMFSYLRSSENKKVFYKFRSTLKEIQLVNDSGFYFEFGFDKINDIGLCYDYNFSFNDKFEICYYDLRNIRTLQIRTYL